MNGNPHTEYLEDTPEWAQVEATRALAFEQHTANLIAAAGMVGTDLTGLPDKTLLRWVDLALEIDTRLGLDTK